VLLLMQFIDCARKQHSLLNNLQINEMTLIYNQRVTEAGIMQ
jgi:hypothetical protein